jgi:N-acetylmuramoyl-L-alanine amidase
MIPILNNGHGGIINGIYQTQGKRSPQWEKGILYEGAFNRWIVNKLIQKLDSCNMRYFHVCPELEDIPLETRSKRVNDIAVNNDYWLLEVHANAGQGRGIEVFTSIGQSFSDTIASHMISLFDDLIVNVRKDFTDNDPDKEADFYMLKKTNCPAMLLECGFMDNKLDYELLWTEAYQNMLVNVMFNTIKHFV